MFTGHICKYCDILKCWMKTSVLQRTGKWTVLHL